MLQGAIVKVSYDIIILFEQWYRMRIILSHRQTDGAKKLVKSTEGCLIALLFDGNSGLTTRMQMPPMILTTCELAAVFDSKDWYLLHCNPENYSSLLPSVPTAACQGQQKLSIFKRQLRKAW